MLAKERFLSTEPLVARSASSRWLGRAQRTILILQLLNPGLVGITLVEPLLGLAEISSALSGGRLYGALSIWNGLSFSNIHRPSYSPQR